MTDALSVVNESRITPSMNPVDALLEAIAAATVSPALFTDDVVLDATVPNWRFCARGREQVTAELRGWFADPGYFAEVHREPLPDGELIEFTLHWDEGGVAHACHQAHIVRCRDGLVSADMAFCGGRWPAPLLEEMGYA